MPKEHLNPPRGTRDFFPEDMLFRNWLFERFKETSRLFGFQEVDAPVLESAELFTRKAGEEIVEQLYHFEIHDRHLALRPEFTPSLARMVSNRAGSIRFPLKWFSIPQCWRYERMTRGRRREHYQWNCDIWGEASEVAEAELIAMIFHCISEMGIPKNVVRLRLNNRALLEETLRAGVLAKTPEAFEPLCVIIDKLDKIGKEAVIEQLCAPSGPVRISRASSQETVDLLSAKTLEEASQNAPPNSLAIESLKKLFSLLEAYGISDRVDFDASVVRGLAYYTGIVFEAFDTAGKLRAICGGGRYDKLLETLGGPSTPAVGFGFGDAVIAELLKEHKILPEVSRNVDAFVLALGKEEQQSAVRLANRLRAEGNAVELALAPMRVRKALQEADRAGASTLYVIGPEERDRGVARARSLESQDEWEVQL